MFFGSTSSVPCPHRGWWWQGSEFLLGLVRVEGWQPALCLAHSPSALPGVQASPAPSHCAVILTPPIPSVHLIVFTPSHPTPPSTSCSSLSSPGAPSHPGPFLPAQGCQKGNFLHSLTSTVGEVDAGQGWSQDH